MKFFSISTGLILTIVVAILLFLFLGKADTGIRSTVDSDICKSSVELSARWRYDKLIAFQSIKCPTLYISADSSNKKVVFDTLALAMADTWNEFLQGKEEIFDTQTQDFCVIRRVVEFSEENKYDGFFDYLLQNNLPNIRMPYYSYLTNTEVEEGKITSSQNPSLKNNDVIDTSTPHAVVFVMAKKENTGKILGAQKGAITGGVVGILSAGALIYITAPISIPVAVAFGGVGAGSVSGFLLGSSYPANWEASTMLVPYTEDSLKQLDCTKLPVSLTK